MAANGARGAVTGLVKAVQRRLGERDIHIGRQSGVVSLPVHLRRLLGEAGVTRALDVGANTGQFGAFLRRELRFTGAIVSFEPASAAHEALARRAADDPRWTVHHLALGSAPDRLDLHLFGAASTINSLHPLSEAGVDRYPGQADAVESVEVVRLDEAIADLPAAPTFLKCDTQGHDLEVLAGLGDRVADVRVLMVEAPLRPLYEGVPDLPVILEACRAHGFDVTGVFPVSVDPPHLVEVNLVLAPL